jgi:diguanylate cyclase
MDERSSTEEIQGCFRLVVPLMTKYGIPITPRNYSVWFEYASGTNGNLRDVIDSMIAGGKEFTEETNEALYRRFCAEGDENQLKSIREDLRQITLAILAQVTDLTGQTQGYESSITNSVDALSENASVDEVKRAIRVLIGETKTIGKFVKTVRGELKETTEALEALKQRFEEVKMEALADFLTGLPNRKAFTEALATNMEDARSSDTPLCLLFIDIDNFTRFNNTFGHLIGDEVLKFVSRKVKEMVRGSDYPARFGGEEFAVILPRTPIAGAEVVAETIRSFFDKTKLKSVSTSKALGTVTVSIGIACHRKGDTLDHFIERSDQALYLAKNKGRNRVAIESDLASENRRDGQDRGPYRNRLQVSPGKG